MQKIRICKLLLQMIKEGREGGKEGGRKWGRRWGQCEDRDPAKVVAGTKE